MATETLRTLAPPAQQLLPGSLWINPEDVGDLGERVFPRAGSSPAVHSRAGARIAFWGVEDPRLPASSRQPHPEFPDEGILQHVAAPPSFRRLNRATRLKPPYQRATKNRVGIATDRQTNRPTAIAPRRAGPRSSVTVLTTLHRRLHGERSANPSCCWDVLVIEYGPEGQHG